MKKNKMKKELKKLDKVRLTQSKSKKSLELLKKVKVAKVKKKVIALKKSLVAENSKKPKLAKKNITKPKSGLPKNKKATNIKISTKKTVNKLITTKTVIRKPVQITKHQEQSAKQAQAVNQDKQFYKPEELKEFEVIILDKIDYVKNELKSIKDSLSRRSESGTDDTAVSSKMLEDGAEASQKESLNQLASRMQKFLSQLESALARIKNGTYGRCIYTGKLIPKERLKAVPHTNYSIEGKKMQQQKIESQTNIDLDYPPADFMPEFQLE